MLQREPRVRLWFWKTHLCSAKLPAGNLLSPYFIFHHLLGPQPHPMSVFTCLRLSQPLRRENFHSISAWHKGASVTVSWRCRWLRALPVDKQEQYLACLQEPLWEPLSWTPEPLNSLPQVQNSLGATIQIIHSKPWIVTHDFQRAAAAGLNREGSATPCPPNHSWGGRGSPAYMPG